MEIEAHHKHTKRKAAHYINTLDDVYIEMVKSFQKKKGRNKLKSVFKDELQVNIIT